MALSTMYDAKPNSPQTTLAGDISAADTSMTLADASVLPAAPNICTIGDDENAEVVIYGTITGNVVSNLIRGSSGTTASVWPAGTYVARDYTSYDHDTFIDNIRDLSTSLSGKQDTLTFDDAPTSESSNPVKSGGVYTGLAGKANTVHTHAASDIVSGKLDVAHSGTGVANVTANKVFAGPSSGDAAAPTWRVLNAADIPNLNADKITAGTLALARGGTGGNDSGWTSCTNSTVFSGTIYYRQVGVFVNVYGSYIKLVNDLATSNITLLASGTVPSPKANVYFPAGNNEGFGQLYISSAGAVQFYKEADQSWSTSRNIHFCVMYMTA